MFPFHGTAGPPVRRRVSDLTPDAEEGVDEAADVHVGLPDEALAPVALTHLRLIRVDQQVPVPVRHDEAQVCVVHHERCAVRLQRLHILQS